MAEPSNQPPGREPDGQTGRPPMQQKGSYSSTQSERRRRQDGRPSSAPVGGETYLGAAQADGLSPSESQRAGGSGSGQWAGKKGPGPASPARVRASAAHDSQRAALDSVVVNTPQRENVKQTGKRGESQGFTWKAKHSRGRSLGRRQPNAQPAPRRSMKERQRLGAPDYRRVAMQTPLWETEPIAETDSDDEDATLEELRNRQRVRVGHLRRISSGSTHWTKLKTYMMALSMKPAQQVFVPEEHEVTRFWRIKVSEEDARFFEAVRHNDVDAINAALAAGADPTSRNEDGNSALHIAVEVDALSALHALLLAGNVNVSASDTQGVTPLHLAVEMGKRLLVNSLIMAGARIDAVDRFGRNPLHYAIRGGKVRIVKLLLYCGADPNMADSYGTTPLSMAVLTRPFPDIARTLLAAGALVDVESGAGVYLLSEAVLACYTETHLDAIRVLLESGAEVNRQEEVSGQTALHLAALSDNGAVAEELLRAGADPSITNFSGETAIEMALLHGSKDVLIVLTSLAAVEDYDVAYDTEFATMKNVVGSMMSEIGLAQSTDEEQAEAEDRRTSGQQKRQRGSSGRVHSVMMQDAPVVHTSVADAAAAAAEQSTRDSQKGDQPKQRPYQPGPDFVGGGMQFIQKHK